MLFSPRMVHYCLRGNTCINLDYGVVYTPSSTFVKFWNYPPTLPPTVPQVLCRSFANLSICLSKAEHNHLVIPDNSSGVLPAISLQHRQSRLFWDEASSRWRNSCRFRTELSLSHIIVRRLHPVAVPWVLELISLFLLSGLSGFRQKFLSSLVGY